jgi:homoserine kinase
MEDRIHQPYRASFVPGLAHLLAIDDDAVVGTALSGAGPSVLALVRGDPDRVIERMRATFAGHGVACDVRAFALAEKGVQTDT